MLLSGLSCTQLYYLLNRYAEGTGTAAKFNDILDIKFLSATTLICSDTDNHCLRLLNLTETMAETSTYAGTCTTAGTTDGHRLHSALFSFQKYIEVNKYNSTIFVVDNFKFVRMIDLKTDEVTTIWDVGSTVRYMVLSCYSLLYFTNGKTVTEFNLNSEEYNVIAGGNVMGKATGSFDDTRFNRARGLLLLSQEGTTLILVGDRTNNRCAEYSLA